MFERVENTKGGLHNYEPNYLPKKPRNQYNNRIQALLEEGEGKPAI